MAPANSIRSLFAYAGSLFSQVPLQNADFAGPTGDVQAGGGAVAAPFAAAGLTPYAPLAAAPSCPIDGPMSCHNQTQTDSCCFIYPGGRLLLTQFWDDTVHVGGSDQDWTLHGLWPDLCDGSYDQYCGMTPRFTNITDTLKQYNQTGLLANMERYWVASYGTNEHLWAHEYNKHASCINTLAPACYGDAYTPGLEVVDYFERAFGLFRMLDTYYALAQAGIEPDYGRTYALDRLQAVLSAFSGGRVILKCGGRHRNVLHEAWYVYFVQGSLQSGQFVPAQDTFKGDHGNCAQQVRYLPKRQKKHGLLGW